MNIIIQNIMRPLGNVEGRLLAAWSSGGLFGSSTNTTN